MPNTSAWNLPYPTGTQVPNVPADIQALAVATDAKLTQLALTYPRITPTGTGSGASFTGAVSTSYTLASFVVPDPGRAYRIRVSASMFISGLTNANGGVSHTFGAMVDTQTLNGTTVAPTAATIGAMFIGQTNTTFAIPSFDRTNPTTYTGSHTVYLILSLGSQGPATWGALNARSDYEFTIQLLPA